MFPPCRTTWNDQEVIEGKGHCQFSIICMNEVLSDTDNPSHLHLDLESNIFFLQKTHLSNHSLLDTMLQSV